MPQNPIQKAHLEGVKEFDRTFLKGQNGGYHLLYPDMIGKQPTMDDFINHFKSFLTTYAVSILNAALEAGPREKEGGCTEIDCGYCISCQKGVDDEHYWQYTAGHNYCRASFISAINEGIKEIKKGDV